MIRSISIHLFNFLPICHLMSTRKHYTSTLPAGAFCDLFAHYVCLAFYSITHRLLLPIAHYRDYCLLKIPIMKIIL
ncbi:hypothetical protein B9Z55_023964 [Caenorhabditis nigoni]|uniref:Uncharacterized protein n=1 Tax=Caenorhabditis nigoni TaxID=1611254 RepID=A0A2G5SSC5_9PELO|nr:hypothetical protein B9Z55_023964 [Caenorhabditis nigoni]